MKKIKFYIGTGFAGCNHEEIIEFEDITEEEIEAAYNEWKDNYIDCCWWEVGK